MDSHNCSRCFFLFKIKNLPGSGGVLLIVLGVFQYEKVEKWPKETIIMLNRLCVFPFIYNHKIYLSCTTDGMVGKKPWCSLTTNYNTGLQWTYCEPLDTTVESPSCIFPFIFKSMSYSTCTSEGMRDGKLWCATTSNYDVDKKWVYCNDTGRMKRTKVSVI
uniref:Fibronectin type-II domain-containing protein n=1 Tax=Anolis carolinensis TaxID=28377 RepID=A0A803TNI8_ANOCA